VLSSCTWGRVVDRDVLVRGRNRVVCSKGGFAAGEIRGGDVLSSCSWGGVIDVDIVARCLLY
jgi:hypothetical protein